MTKKVIVRIVRNDALAALDLEIVSVCGRLFKIAMFTEVIVSFKGTRELIATILHIHKARTLL